MNIQNKKEFTLPFAGRTLTCTLSDVAGQANASVVVEYGNTSVLVTTVMGSQDRAIDFFPLTVDYEERFYAAGKIIGSRFIRREGRPSQEAVLSGRLIDRSIRPLFDSRLRRDVQVVVTILSYDEENDPDFVALFATSLALSISDIPWNGPIAGVRLLYSPTQIVINPSTIQVDEALTVAGTAESFFAGRAESINMIELGGREIPESGVEELFTTAQRSIQELIAFQQSIIASCAKPKAQVALREFDPALVAAVRDFGFEKLSTIAYIAEGSVREDAMKTFFTELEAHLVEKGIEDRSLVGAIVEDCINEIVHKGILESGKRPDGRAVNEIRPLSAQVGIFSRLHGSALFMRGHTQSLGVTTLAAPGSEQFVETMESTMKRRFMLHYNFPPYATGEVGRVGNPGRREIGHGALAEKALRAVIPSKETFPYTIRIVSEILSSNGSSSMASVCAGTLSLMDAGVPIRKPVAGIAMGLMTHQGYDEKSAREEYSVLVDLQGFEDHYGDMDLKVAGTTDGVTAVQMDLKITGITPAIFHDSLVAAREARMKILDVITTAIPAPRTELSQYAPIIQTTTVKPSQIGMVIGQGGKTINGLIEKYKLDTIDIDDDGTVFVSGTNRAAVAETIAYIQNLTKEFEVGEVVTGPIIKMLDFGAIVDLGGGKDGMIHVSELKNGFVEKVSDVVQLNQEVTAKVIKVEESGKISLSMKALAKNTGEEKRPHEHTSPQHPHHKQDR